MVKPKFRVGSKVCYNGKKGRVTRTTHQKTDGEVFVVFGKNDSKTIHISKLRKC